MYIDDIEEGQKVELLVKMGKDSMSFETHILERRPRRHMILTDIVKINEKILGFNVQGMSIDVNVYPLEGPPLVFKRVAISLNREKDRVTYAISTPSEGKILNRRENYRVFVGKDAVVQRGLNRSVIDAILKDISLTGFAITADTVDRDGKLIELNENQLIHTVLQDRIEETYKDYNFTLYGIIVRKQELENGKIVYGCKLNQKVPELEGYINTKARLELKKRSGN